MGELPDDLHLMARKWIAMENGDPNFIQTVGHVPDTLRRYIRWSSAMWRKGLIPNRTKEICRIRIANSNECRYCMTMRYETAQNQGMTATLENQLEDYEAGDFPEREKAALRYTDEIYMDNITWDYERVPDDVYERLSAQFTEPEIVELTWAISIAIEYGRNFTVWGVPVTEEKVREPLDQVTERLNSTVDAQVDEENRAALTELAALDPPDARSISTLLARPDMLGPVLKYHRYIRDEGLLEPNLKRAVKAEVLRLEDGNTDGPSDSADYPPRVQAALEWTRGMAVDFRELVDNPGFLAKMQPHFSIQELVELGMYSGSCLALRRIRAILGRRVATERYGLALAARRHPRRAADPLQVAGAEARVSLHRRGEPWTS
jgi:AhpD family alkylhydroperoxidase